MIIAKGSKVVIEGLGDGVYGVLAEELNVNLKSSFRPLASDFQNEITKAMDIAGSVIRSVSKGRAGFSSQFKQMTTQVWDKTDPARFSLNVDFHRTRNDPNNPEVSGKNVMDIVRRFARIPLPSESGSVAGALGNLTPPGPSPIEGIGLDQIFGSDEETAVEASGFVNVIVGRMKFRRLLMEKAEPTFSKYTDDSGYPISCRVAFDFVSLWAATQQMLDDWSN